MKFEAVRETKGSTGNYKNDDDGEIAKPAYSSHNTSGKG